MFRLQRKLSASDNASSHAQPEPSERKRVRTKGGVSPPSVSPKNRSATVVQISPQAFSMITEDAAISAAI